MCALRCKLPSKVLKARVRCAAHLRAWQIEAQSADAELLDILHHQLRRAFKAFAVRVFGPVGVKAYSSCSLTCAAGWV